MLSKRLTFTVYAVNMFAKEIALKLPSPVSNNLLNILRAEHTVNNCLKILLQGFFSYPWSKFYFLPNLKSLKILCSVASASLSVEFENTASWFSEVAIWKNTISWLEVFSDPGLITPVTLCGPIEPPPPIVYAMEIMISRRAGTEYLLMLCRRAGTQ